MSIYRVFEEVDVTKELPLEGYIFAHVQGLGWCRAQWLGHKKTDHLNGGERLHGWWTATPSGGIRLETAPTVWLREILSPEMREKVIGAIKDVDAAIEKLEDKPAQGFLGYKNKKK